eukprot:1140334-Pelagomonas_calceolata.AAC.7
MPKATAQGVTGKLQCRLHGCGPSFFVPMSTWKERTEAPFHPVHLPIKPSHGAKEFICSNQLTS